MKKALFLLIIFTTYIKSFKLGLPHHETQQGTSPLEKDWVRRIKSQIKDPKIV